MKKEILKCPKCDNYTLKNQCPKCDTKTLSPKPMKYSPEDKYGKWRRTYKKNVIRN
ncbi:MAG: ribosome biogenesis protein [Nanoarchaeota archaeon]|nr:ribosome biogenesis protein [Nanoarchaeota archaeon]|tara:strand:+ start:1456 stop:1623 length:168 start_codon:yes stop_codon:yes gene_type:complete